MKTASYWTKSILLILLAGWYPCSSSLVRSLEDMRQDAADEDTDEITKSCFFTQDNSRICNYCTDDDEFCISEMCSGDECSVCATKVDEFGYAVYVDFCLELSCDADTIFSETMDCQCQKAKVYGVECDSCSLCGGGFSFEAAVAARDIGVGMALSCSAYEDGISTCGTTEAVQTSNRLMAFTVVSTLAFFLLMGTYYRYHQNSQRSQAEIRAALNLEKENILD